ncbi:hypothetical protein, conserved [Eimeria brunetti]|uniref:Uncharacterized protein n=1 Tax=Eimeria brunetti TaxID=51314 RepID=U6L8L3_9EIME|nr:hypothetical protein, conserved [Eimeria brunetti]
MVCFQVNIENKKITGMKEIHRSKNPLQRGFVAELIASKGPWVVTRSEGDDTEIRVHSYEGDLLASVDTKQIRNLQLSLSDDGCLFGCAAWSPGVKIFEVKAKAGNFQKAGEDTKLVAEAPLSLSEQAMTTLHYSRDGSVIIVVSGRSLYLFRAEGLQMIKAVENLTTQPIERLIVAPNNKFVVLCEKGLRPAIVRLPLTC